MPLRGGSPPRGLGRRLDPSAGPVEVLGSRLLVRPRGGASRGEDEPGEADLARWLGERERSLLAEMPWTHRREEWLAGRAAAKALLEAVPREWLGLEPAPAPTSGPAPAPTPGARLEPFDPRRVQVLPRASGAPSVWVDGVERPGCALGLSHSRRYVVVAAARGAAVGVDVCDVADAARVARSARRVFGAGEAERCGVGEQPWRQVAAWAVKEAVLKLDQGGVFVPGLASVRLESLAPPRLLASDARVELLLLPEAVVAIARRHEAD